MARGEVRCHSAPLTKGLDEKRRKHGMYGGRAVTHEISILSLLQSADRDESMVSLHTPDRHVAACDLLSRKTARLYARTDPELSGLVGNP